MVEIPQWLVNWALTGAGFIVGMMVKTLWNAQQKLTADVQELSIKLAENYVTNYRLEQLQQALFQKLDRIEDKIDGKADK